MTRAEKYPVSPLRPRAGVRATSTGVFTSCALGLLCTVGLIAAGCASTPDFVDRVENGRTWRGRYVPPESYAWYARGVHLEAQGQIEAAEAAFLEAVQYDAGSGSLWARIGKLRCQRGDDAEEAFQRGFAAGSDRTVVLIERSHCALQVGRLEEALDDATRAVTESPDNPDASLAVIDALQALGRTDDAERWLDALAAWAPTAREVQARRLLDAESQGDLARQRRAHEARSQLLRALDLPPEDPDVVVRGKAAIDAALIAGQLELAFKRATTLGVSLSELSLRCIALGRPDLGFDLAELVLTANPSDANARLAAELTADLLAKSPPAEVRGEIERPLGAELHPLAVLLFAELLDRKVGSEAGTAWRRAQKLEVSRDPLVERLRTRKAPEEATAGSHERATSPLRSAPSTSSP